MIFFFKSRNFPFFKTYHEILQKAVKTNLLNEDETREKQDSNKVADLQPSPPAWRRKGSKSLVFAVHSFTPLYRPGGLEPDDKRVVEVGILFDQEEELAICLKEEMEKRGVRVWLNEPYTGKAGLVYRMHPDPTVGPTRRYLSIGML